jgi:hypothetical protein
VSLADIQQTLFARLRKHYANKPAFLDSIALWEQSCPADDRIPKGALSDKQVHELRTRSQMELRFLGVQEGLPKPDGTEFFGP